MWKYGHFAHLKTTVGGSVSTVRAVFELGFKLVQLKMSL